MLTLTRRLSKVKTLDPNIVTTQHIKNAQDVPGARLELINAIATSKNPAKREVMAELIPSFATYFQLQGSLHPEVAFRLVEVNPERVHSNLDLLRKVERPSEDLVEKIMATALDRDVLDMDEIAYLIRGHSFSDSTLERAVLVLAEKDLSISPIVDKVPLGVAAKLLGIESGSVFASLFSKVFATDPSLLNAGHFKRALEHLDQDLEPILHYIEQSSIDTEASANELRLALIYLYGMQLSDIQGALKKNSLYQTKCKPDIETLQFALCKCFAFQSIKQENNTYSMVAESLLPPQPTVRSLCLQIVSQADSEKALKVYNDYIQQVSRTANDKKRSQSGLLTEALMVSSLYDNDREFAQLLYEKAIQGKVVTDEFEITHLKRLFRVYGDCFQDNDTWDVAKERMKRFVLDFIREV